MKEVSVFLGRRLQATCYNAEAKTLIVSFDHYRKDRMNGFYPIKPLKIALSLGCAVLVIKTAANDWYMNEETYIFRKTISQFAGKFFSVRGIGFSMGGYACLQFSADLYMEHTLLISPQISLCPTRAPWDKRFSAEANEVDWSQEITCSESRIKGVTLYDPYLCQVDERHSKEVFLSYPGIAPVAIPFGGHPATAPFKRSDLMRSLYVALISGNATPDVIARIQHHSLEIIGD